MFKKLEKISEGGFNRVFLTTMHDSFRAIVKVSYWISVLKTYATAIEVATLSFLRAKGIPVPEVYGWFSTINNPAGLEHIVMEYALGIGSDSHWCTTTKNHKHALVTGIVGMEKKLSTSPLLLSAAFISRKTFPLSSKGNCILQGL